MISKYFYFFYLFKTFCSTFININKKKIVYELAVKRLFGNVHFD